MAKAASAIKDFTFVAVLNIATVVVVKVDLDRKILNIHRTIRKLGKRTIHMCLFILAAFLTFCTQSCA